MFGLLIFCIMLTALAALSVLYGVDSREDSTDPRSPAHPVGIN